MEALADRSIGQPATPEDRWSDWLAHASVAAFAWGDWLRADQRLVVVAPHPDDEVLACGGLLNLHAARGGPCRVIAVTDGGASHEGSAGWTPSTLAAARRGESERGLDCLGVAARCVERLGIDDGEVRGNAQRLVAALRASIRRDDLVVGTWRLDGHPDHDASGEATAAACAAAGACFVEAPVWMWHWSRPSDPRVPWARLRALPLPASAQRRKASALARHTTQLEPREHADGTSEGPILDAAILRRAARPTEYFFVPAAGSGSSAARSP